MTKPRRKGWTVRVITHPDGTVEVVLEPPGVL